MTIILLIILLPVVTGIVCFNLKDEQIKKVSFVSLLLQIALAVTAVVMKPDNIEVFRFTEDIRFVFGVDALSVLFLLLISVIWFFVQIYSFGYMEHEEHRPRYYMFFMFTLAALMGLSVSRNLVTMYFCYEMMTLMSVPLVFHTQTKEAIGAGMKYLGYSIFGAGFGLMGIFYIYYFGKSLDFLPGGIFGAGMDEKSKGLLLIVYLLMMIGFGCKAGMFPLHAWLPTAHPIAPSPASAVLSGIITKGGVIAIIRVTFYIFGVDFLKHTWANYACLTLAIFTIFMGSMLAFKEKVLKRRLAYSTISQVSYVLFALFSMTEIAMVGALLQVLFHSLAKNLLFLSAGSIIFTSGYKKVDELKGIGKQMPFTLFMFTLGSLSLIGIPPLGGFVSKWYIGNGVLGTMVGFAGVITLMISALLTAGYTLPIIIDGFFAKKEEMGEEVTVKESPKPMLIALGFIAAILLVISVFPDSVIDFYKGIAGTIF